MRCLKIAALLFGFLAIQILAAQSCEAQNEFQNFKRDYSKPLFYQPNDPFVRGKIFRMHTKHIGGYYNCNCEESKRNSPYIGWKEHTDCDFVPKKKFMDCFKDDLSEIKQRIADGAGNCYRPEVPQAAMGCQSCGANTGNCSCRFKNRARFTRPVRPAGGCSAGCSGCATGSCGYAAAGANVGAGISAAPSLPYEPLPHELSYKSVSRSSAISNPRDIVADRVAGYRNQSAPLMSGATAKDSSYSSYSQLSDVLLSRVNSRSKSENGSGQQHRVDSMRSRMVDVRPSAAQSKQQSELPCDCESCRQATRELQSHASAANAVTRPTAPIRWTKPGTRQSHAVTPAPVARQAAASSLLDPNRFVKQR